MAGLCKPKPESASTSRSRSRGSKDDWSQAAHVALSVSQSRDFLVDSLVCLALDVFLQLLSGSPTEPLCLARPQSD